MGGLFGRWAVYDVCWPGTTVDILYLLDRLEEVLSAGQKVPLTRRTLIDEQECLEILDQIRVAVPEEFKQAKRVTQQRDEILAQARQEASRVMQSADEQIAGQITEHAIVRAARERAADVEEEALRRAEEIRREADLYAYRVLERLRDQIHQVATTVEQDMDSVGMQEPPRVRARAR